MSKEQIAAREAHAKEVLQKDTVVVPEFWVNKYKTEAKRNWDLFYKRNTTNFYKDRHWTDREFEELRAEESENSNPGEETHIFEVGCGVGNFIWPLLEKNPKLKVYCCDFSPRAVQFVKEHKSYTEERCKAFVCDITKDDLLDNIPPQSIDIISLIFVFSALAPEKMQFAVENLLKVLKPGGIIIFRDYGLYDEAQLRFKPGHRLEENLYVRQDGTMSYYFSVERLRALFVDFGKLVEKENRYVFKETSNVKRNVKVDRIFVQAKFQLAPAEISSTN